MISEMVLAPESFPTDFAGVWPFVCVCSLMDQKIVGFGEMATTIFTDELFFGPSGPATAWSLDRGEHSWWKVTDGRKAAGHWVVPAMKKMCLCICMYMLKIETCYQIAVYEIL